VREIFQKSFPKILQEFRNMVGLTSIYILPHLHTKVVTKHILTRFQISSDHKV